MAIDWIYDTTYVSFGVEWNAAYKAVGKVTIQPVVYRWDRYNTADSSKFSETLRYEPNGSTGSWSNIGWGSGSGTRSIDPFAQRTYSRKAAAYTVQLEIATDGGFGTAYDGYYHTIGAVTRTATYTVPALPPAFNTLTATRVSDNQVNLSWTAASGNIKAVCIERSTDGGSYSEVAVIWNPAATSWQDNATTADHSYTYRARYHHEGAYGAYSNTVTVTMTPSAPQTISTAAISGSTNVAVTLGNASPVATSLEWQASTDGGTTWSASTTVSGSPVTSFTATGISGTALIRVRNVNTTGTSAWLVSDPITTICPPAPPTLRTPSGSVYDMAQGDIEFSWLHNSLDGSAQSAYELRYAINGGAWTTLTGATAQSRTVSIGTFSAGDSVSWQVRTKGADASYSDWSAANTFNVYTAPTLSITSPGATITGMPIQLTATYSDMAGFTCQAATVALTQGGRTLFSEPCTISGTSITAQLDTSEFLPANGESYTVVLTARSSSSLQATANATFTTAFTEPQAGELSITNDPETGYVSLLATFEQHEQVPLAWELGTLSLYDGTDIASSTRARSIGVSTVQTDAIYAINGTGKINVHSYQNGVWKKSLGDWYNLPFYYYSETYDGLRIVMKNADDSAIVINAIDIKCENTALPSDQTYSGNTNVQYESTEGYVRSLTVEGKSEVVRGKNIATTAVYKQDYVIGGSGAESAAGDYIITVAVPVEAGETYAGSYGHADPSSTDPLRVGIYTSGMVFISRPVINDSTTTITMPSNAAFVRFSYATAGSNALTNVQFEKGSTATAYEPYFAPYLQSIESTDVVGKNLVLELYQGAITQGEGYAQLNSAAGGTVAVAKIEPNTDYTIFAKTYTGANRRRLYLCDRDPRGNEQIADYRAVESASSFDSDWTHTFDSRTYPWVMFGMSTSAVAYNPDAVVQIEKGTTATAYEPPNITTITATLRSAGDIADELQVDGTEAKIARKVGVVDLGTLTWSQNGALSGGGTQFLVHVSGRAATANGLCNAYPVSTPSSTKYNTVMLRTNGDIVLFNHPTYTTSDAAAFKASMSGVYLYYELATPTEETLSDIPLIELGSVATVETDIDSTFEMVGWDGSADAVSVSVSRVNADGTITPLIEDGGSGAAAVDKYAPLNTPYQYAVTTKSSANAVKTVYMDNEIVTDLWFAYWTHKDGETVTEMVASAKWNPDNGGIQIARPQKTRVYYAGRKDPVSYDGAAVSLTETPSWMVVDRSEVEPFVQLIEDGGRGVYKSCDGWVYHADFDLTLTPKYTAIGYYGGVGLSVTRIAGDSL